MADETPSRAQMIADLKKSSGQGVVPSRAQMIADLKSSQQDDSSEGPWSGNVIKTPEEILQNADSSVQGAKSAARGSLEALPTAGAIAGGMGGAALGTAVAPGPGTVGGEIAGAGIGSALGKTAQNAIDKFIFGENKDLSEGVGTAAAVGAASQGIGMGALKAGSAIAESSAGKAVGNLAAKAGEALTGVAAPVIKKYAQAAEIIKKMSDDAGGNIAAAADSVKKYFNDSIKQYAVKLQAGVDSALEQSTAKISPESTIKALEEALDGIDTSAPGNKALFDKTDELLAYVKGKQGSDGLLSAKDADAVKGQLQDFSKYEGASTAYQDAARDGAAKMRLAIHKEIPEVATLNNQQSALINIQKRMNPSILKERASASALIGAGSDQPGGKEATARTALALRELGNMVGEDFVGKSQDLAAMQEFAGLAAKRMGAGAGVGAATGYALDGHGGAAKGAVIGGALTSPLVLKGAINAGRLAVSAGSSPVGQATLGQAIGQGVMHGSGAMNALKPPVPNQGQ